MAIRPVTKRKRTPVKVGIPVVEFGKPFMIAGCKIPAIINQYSTSEDPDSFEIKISGFNRVSKHV